MLLDKERLMMQGKRILRAYASEEWVNRVSYVTRVAVQTFSNFFVGQFIDALILGIMVGISLLHPLRRSASAVYSFRLLVNHRFLFLF